MNHIKNIARKIVVTATVGAILTSSLMVSAERADASPYSSEGDSSVVVASSSSGSVAKSEVVKYSSMKASINKYAQVNNDVKGWLYIPNTNINMPIIKPADNFFYEKRTIEGVNYPNNNYKNYKTTATYTDYRVKLGNTWNSTSKNIVIYGHNWTNLKAPFAIGNQPGHVMFGQLPSYNSIDFAKQNPYIYFSTGENEGIWKIFSVAYIETDYNVFGYNKPNPTTEEFEKMIKEFKARSLYNTDTAVSTGDRILTLDTCIRQYSGVGEAQRFVVVARLLRDGETEKDPVTIVKNPSPKQPNFVRASAN